MKILPVFNVWCFTVTESWGKSDNFDRRIPFSPHFIQQLVYAVLKLLSFSFSKDHLLKYTYISYTIFRHFHEYKVVPVNLVTTTFWATSQLGLCLSIYLG